MSYTIQRITNGPATLTKFNTPIQQIETALNELSTRVDTTYNRSAIIQSGVTLSSDAYQGALVYFDSTQPACFRPAIAALAAEPGTQGQSVQAPSARVQGWVISKNPPCLLRNGYYQDSRIETTLGIGAAAGQYFLSPVTAGKATQDPGWNMRQPCLTYYGDSKFSMTCSFLAHDNHHHQKYVLQPTPWTDIQSDSSSPYYGKPKRAVSGAQGVLNQQIAVVFQNENLSNDYAVGGSTIWYTGEHSPDVNTVTIFSTAPFAYGDSVVRSITSDTLSINDKNGTFDIQFPGFSAAQVNYAGVSISSLQGTTLNYTPVVSGLLQGAGITINAKGSGRYRITASNADVNVPVVAQDTYFNGTALQYADGVPYIIFPGPSGDNTNTSAVTISKFFKQLPDQDYTVNVWLTGKCGATQTIAITLKWIPVGWDAQTPPSEVTASYSPLTLGASSSLLLYKTIEGSLKITGEGTLYATLQMSPTEKATIHRAGFIITSADSSDSSSYAADITAIVRAELSKTLIYNAQE